MRKVLRLSMRFIGLLIDRGYDDGGIQRMQLAGVGRWEEASTYRSG
jgi:hypothetical protein